MIKIGALLVNFEQREILRQGLPLRISARAFDILEVLFRANGSIVSKDELIDSVWPDQIVEENRLQVHIAALRKALEADRELIKTVSGRGYILLPQLPAAAPAALATRLPGRAPVLVGRAHDVENVVAKLAQSAVVTLVGAGGIGKTALALCVAEAVQQRFGRTVCFVELASASSRASVLATLALALQATPADVMQDPCALLAKMSPDGVLLVLDNAEQVVGEVAEVVEALVAHARWLRVLVTSREPLTIRAETVYRVEPLDVPAADEPLETMRARGAVQLFLQRARDLAPACATDAASVRAVSEICRRLEGLPLAIELAAARVATLGIDGVAARLDDRLDLLSGGLRLALPRHQTLRATFDWSYTLLDANAKTLFRSLAFFAGSFAFDAVCAVAIEPGVPIASTIAALGELAAKSLLTVEFHGAIALYRLTESTRAYAMEKLRDEGELQRVAQRHLRYLQRQIEDRSALVPHRGQAGGADAPLDAARSAWDWAFSAQGDATLGVALAGSLVGRLLDASLVHECRERAQRALETLDALPHGSVDATCEMRVCSAYAAALLMTDGAAADAAALWRRVQARAVASGDAAFEARAMWGLWNAAMTAGDIHASLRFATRFESRALSSGSAWQKLCASATLAASLHCFGEHAQARERLERTLAALDTTAPQSRADTELAIDPRIFGTGTLARIVWMQGETAFALALIERGINLVRPDLLEPSLCHLLAVVAVPVALACGESELAARHLGLLRSQAALNRFDGWQDYGDCLAGRLALAAGRRAEGIAQIEAGLARLEARNFRRLTIPLILSLAQALIAEGRLDEAFARIEDAQRQGNARGDHAFDAELMRVSGAIDVARARSGYAAGEPSRARLLGTGHRKLAQALELAREQQAWLFELRAALDLAASLAQDGARREAAELLASLTRFDAQHAGDGEHARLPEAAQLAALRRELATPEFVAADSRDTAFDATSNAT
ncbi:transcriptional regulator [Burkholderia sp. SRS-W-2-2016]|uniref:winged helix-turn-helix domain-containing protein n=1 Tax=Burkholderia sp. SRS-W-2-2016 TaxID=1926878 RepID=UPI00094AF03A|nr:winged helix-turn-helix domain-containing protein [Burkholderia sp. SRS-W-2-2016]OLL29255.1 transcriptional regulator [Burkholderia sp. SRS-W-2-2016]